MADYTRHLLPLLPRDAGLAMSAADLCKRWCGEASISEKTARRYLKKSTASTPGDPSKMAIAIPPAKGGVRKPWRYYRNPAYASGPSIIGYQQEARAALISIASHLEPRTEAVVNLSRLVTTDPDVQKRLADGIRFANDWIGRVPAAIHSEVLEACVKALGHRNVLHIEIHDRHDELVVTRLDVRPMGLVVKDATTYLVAADANDVLTAYALHRVLRATESFETFPERSGFNLDDYIRDTHGFSFPITDDLTLKKIVLQVAPETIYHFKERPLPNQERIDGPDSETGWFKVTAEVPFTILLVPFLLSMGHWIRVVAPETVVNEMAYRSHRMAAHYTAEQAAHPSPFANDRDQGFSVGHEP